MNKQQNKYFNTAKLMNEALLLLLEKKEYEFITVKEICQKAGVNRSTFYLHYETINDLLEETIYNINKNFYEKFNFKLDINELIKEGNSKALELVNKDYLYPYLTFVKENKLIFKLTMKKPKKLNADGTILMFINDIFKPILNYFNIKKEEQNYILAFYLKGLFGIIEEWIANDCLSSIDDIITVINKCVPKLTI